MGFRTSKVLAALVPFGCVAAAVTAWAAQSVPGYLAARVPCSLALQGLISCGC